MLQWIAKHSPTLTFVCAAIGFCFPKATSNLLPLLPYLLFFLMFFTLLGIEQRTLLRRLFTRSVWQFALIQNVGFCLVVTLITYLCGVRGDVLLAIAAVCATAPLFATGALVKSVGLDALQAMAKTIATTFVMPVVLLIVLMLFAADDAHLEMGQYVARLLIYIAGPIVLAALVRHFVPLNVLETYYPKLSHFTVISIFAWPLAFVPQLRFTFDKNPSYAIGLLLLSFVLVYGGFVIGYFYRRGYGLERSVPSAIACGSRNVLLTYSIAGPYLGSQFLPLVGAIQLPMYAMPMVAAWLIVRLQKKEAHAKG